MLSQLSEVGKVQLETQSALLQLRKLHYALMFYFETEVALQTLRK